MFTGIIEEVGIIRSIRKGAHSVVLTIGAKSVLSDVRPGDSIAVNGVCLTVTAFTGSEFTADVMHETMNRSSFRFLRTGEAVNLERALPANGRFGGHIVMGHIDGTGVILSIQRDGNAIWYKIRPDAKILHYIVEKGSIAVDGISLTVAKVSDYDFSVSVIPHTVDNTSLSKKRTGDTINLENDCIGKYIEKFLVHRNLCSAELATPTQSATITKGFLAEAGY